MKPVKSTIVFLIAIGTTLGLNSNSNADRFASRQVNYDLVIQHSHDLENIAVELKDRFRDQFRYSRLFGKLVSRSSKIRNRSHKIHKYGLSRGTCNWDNEIRLLDELVFELSEYVDQAIYRSRKGYDAQLCGNTVRSVRRLIGKAEYHVAGLKKSFYATSRPTCAQPGWNFNNSNINEPAPNFVPNRGSGYRNYNSNRNENFVTRNDWSKSHQAASNRNFASRSNFGFNRFNNVDFDRQGIAVNVGGFKFYVNK